MSAFTEYIGVVARTHGLDGTLVLMDTVGIPDGLVAGMSVAIGYSRDFASTYTIDVFDATPMRTHVHLREITSEEAAKFLIEQAVYVKPSDVGFDDDDRFRIGDIEGCSVVTDEGVELGVITDVWLMPANDVWVVTMPDGRTVPLPVIDDVVLTVDTAARRVVVHLLPGLMELSTSAPNDAHE